MAGSSAQFDVFPRYGTLPPFGGKGVQFEVTYTPVGYGKTQVGNLVIQTEEAQWMYQIRGTHPSYEVPEMVRFKLRVYFLTFY